MIIRNKYLGISNQDVLKEQDLTILKKWLIDIEENITCMDMAISQAKLKAYEEGIYSNNEWFNKIVTANRLQKILKVQIEQRIEELVDTNIDKYLIQVLKKDYTERAWQVIVEKAKLLKDGQSNKV
jgi:hypothetical protein